MICWMIFTMAVMSISGCSCSRKQAHQKMDNVFELVVDAQAGRYDEVIEDVVDLMELDMDLTPTPREALRIDMEKIDPEELEAMRKKLGIKYG